ncbi:hypothetical protein FA15DRAFT_681165 [Coprinopsis marcescibilis]|uniref:Plasma-membrane choline transporter-domain-containing protein n=1 Tax=Coprinopsis marcescibilis TaxID=230819 RepID=A0A5C3KSP3_COPMA|nr:hypothetical protein FA15DRAFT_681165 [Coprinopsis marcescibilis]
MAASFAAYASQYLNRQQQQPAEASILSSSHPMFFSFSTEDGSRGGHGPDSALLDDYDLDDPHLNLRESEASEATARRGAEHRDDEDDDPYLRLDEDERTGRHGFQTYDQQQRATLIAADEHASISSSSGSPKGWLAHLAASPSLHIAALTPRPVRSPSPAHSSSSESAPPPELFGRPSSSKGQQHQTPSRHQPPPPPRTQRDEPHSLSLTESLLPRDGRSRPLDVFSLPDPRHTPRGRRRHNDSIWTSAWLTGVSICFLSAFILLFAVRIDDKVPRRYVPYVTLLHTVPLLTILTFVSAGVAYVHIFLLQIFVKPVMVATSVFIPVTLFISALWAFIGSFMWEEGTDPTWGETVGLRLFSIIPLILAFYTGRRLLHLPNQIHTTSSTLTLTTHLLISNPFLLALSPTVLLVMLLVSIPFLTLIFRLLLIGYATQLPKGWQWHVYAWANWAIFAAVAVWLWTWGVARGVMRMTAASVIGAWYFADPALPPPPPSSTHTIHSALFRATGQSLGTTVLSALILTTIRLLTLLTIVLQRLPLYLPLRVVGIVMPAIRFIIGYIDGATTALSKYALVYAGLTGDNFMGSAKRARALTSGIESTLLARGRRKGFGKEPPLTLLTISPLVLTFPFALITYLFVAHTLKSPNEALGAAVLAGGVTALVGLFCVGLVKDTADTMYLCYCIDKDLGERRREEVFVIFEPETAGRPNQRQAQPVSHHQQHVAAQQQQQRAPQHQVPQHPQHNDIKQPQLPQQRQASSSQVPQHSRLPSFGSTTAKSPLGNLKTQPLLGARAGGQGQAQQREREHGGPFLSDEDMSPEVDDGEVDPFKKSLVVEVEDEDDMYMDDSRLVRAKAGKGIAASPPQTQVQPPPVRQQIHQQQTVQPPARLVPVSPPAVGAGGRMTPGLGQSPPVNVNAFMHQRNRHSGGSFSRSPPVGFGGVGIGVGTLGGVGNPVGRTPPAGPSQAQERMLSSAEMNMKSHVLEGQGRGKGGLGGSIDVDSDGDDHGSLTDLYGRGSRQSAMEEEDVNPFEAGGDMESGMGASRSVRADGELDESDLYPGSGFFN